MIVTFTDFGVGSPYLAQMEAAVYQVVSEIKVLHLIADAPTHRPQLAGYLLAAYAEEFPLDTVFLCVVDPGVGTVEREPVIVRARGRWFVGPGNGLFGPVVAQSRERGGAASACWRITWRPSQLSSSFHGRDLFAPVAARLAAGEGPERLAEPCTAPGAAVPPELSQIIYFDHFGNGFTGLRADGVSPKTRVAVGGHHLTYAATFGAVAAGEGFWYRNSIGLVEIAVNQGSAKEVLGLSLGDTAVCAL